MKIRAGLVVVRNSLLPIGAYVLDWSKPEATFWLWCDGVSSLFATALAILLLAMSEDRKRRLLPTGVSHHVMLTIAGILALALIGLPYWFGMALLLLKVFDPSFLLDLVSRPVVLVILVATLLSNVIEEAIRGVGLLSVAERRRQFDWDFQMHTLRAAAIIVCVALPIEVIAFVVAAVLSYSEIRRLGTKRVLRVGSP